MKLEELKDKSIKDLNHLVSDLKKEKFNFRMQRAAGNQVSISRLRQVKKEVAQVLTEISKRTKNSDR